MSDERQTPIKAAARAAFPHTIPVLTGFFVLGLAYGILMKTNGHGIWLIFLMSSMAFCGSMQFAAVPLLVSPFDPLGAFMLSLMVNARHLFYGVSLLDKYKGLGKIRAFLIFALCDETFSIVSSTEPPDGIERKHFYFFVSLFDYAYWVLSCVLGGVVGGFITVELKGLDFVLTALFVVLFIEQMKTAKNRASGIIGVLCSAICLAIFGAANMVIPSMLLILTVLVLGREKI